MCGIRPAQIIPGPVQDQLPCVKTECAAGNSLGPRWPAVILGSWGAVYTGAQHIQP